MRAITQLLFVVALLNGCSPVTGSDDDGGAAPGSDGGAVPDEVAGAALLQALPGLWSGPATQTPLGDFPIMNMDLRPASDHVLFSRVDLDADNSLRFAFSIEEHGGAPVLVFRNGGLFQGILRDSRTTLREHGAGTWRFCHVEQGCDYIDATWTVQADEARLDAIVNGSVHVVWDAAREEERTPAAAFPVDRTAQPGDAPLPTMPSLRATVTFPALAADADLWVLLSTVPCGTSFSCTTARSMSVAVASSATSAEVVLDQLHGGAYFANAILDRDRNLASTLGPSSGDGIAALDRDVTVADEGESDETWGIAFTLP